LCEICVIFTAAKQLAELYHKAGAVKSKITKEEAIPMGKYIFKINEYQAFDKDEKLMDTSK